MPLWRTLGKASWVLKGRTLPKTVAVVAGVLALLVALVVVPWKFKMQAKGTLEPVDRHEVFAGIEGVVEEVHVQHGQKVEPGELLARLRNTELELEIDKNLGELATTEERIRSIQRRLSEAKRQRDATLETQLMGEWGEYELRKQSILAQQRLYQQKAEQLQVRGPAAGQVLTWDVDNLLIRRPVQRGDVLMRIANPEGPWELVILMPDKRMGHVVRAELKRREEESNQPLLTEFILATDPDTTHVGRVREIGEAAEVHGEEGNAVRIKVEITDKVKRQLLDALPPGASLRKGTTVTAKIDCGRRPIGYVLFHELIAFVQSKILFRWF